MDGHKLGVAMLSKLAANRNLWIMLACDALLIGLAYYLSYCHPL
jgi:hypothetical protein